MRPLVWTAALIAPFILEVAVFGTVLHNPDDGASLWLAGEFLVVALGAVSFLAATFGAMFGMATTGDCRLDLPSASEEQGPQR